jgi:[ribosomal protein S5]-alanine N-acetyltransferase
LAWTEPLPTIDLARPGWRLRAWRASDAAALAQHASNPNVWRWMSDSFPQHYTLDIAKHWVTRGHTDAGDRNWAIAFNDETVGGCGIHPGAGHFRCNAELGWWLAELHWGQGITSLVARALVEQAFDNPEITRLFAPIHAGNERSMSVARNAGFTLESIQRRSAIKAGAVIDRHVFSRIRED